MDVVSPSAKDASTATTVPPTAGAATQVTVYVGISSKLIVTVQSVEALIVKVLSPLFVTATVPLSTV